MSWFNQKSRIGYLLCYGFSMMVWCFDFVKSTTLTDIFSVIMFVRVLRQHAKLLASRIRPFTTTASTPSPIVSLNPNISYVHGVPDTSTGYSSLTLGQVLERQAELNPNKVAFIVDHQQITKTYSKFNSDVMNCFALTRKLNVLICIS